IAQGLVIPGDYDAIIWISGEEASADASFNQAEQAIIANYLAAGGNLLISGSEIGYDLVDQGSSADAEFYQQYFKATYVADRAVDQFGDISFRIDPQPGTLLAGLAPFNFDDGSHGSYFVDWPDGIKPSGGAVSIARYADVDYSVMGGAGISYEGTFANGAVPGHLVYLAVGFETIYPAAARDSLMARILDFFQMAPDTSTPGAVLADRLYQNYPNPFMEETQIPYDVLTGGNIRLTVYNLRGALVRRLVSGYQPADHYTYTFLPFDRRGRRLASGLYIITLQVGGGQLQSRKMILHK
ncbi:MAG: T9SS type A sorting domain-containing protein, partial [Candidatus Marinimicrobia bacterium]|nr:T9SS type A sorting domain-containing protein [Candidatus Neomarinimicrobiota bacterium]